MYSHDWTEISLGQKINFIKMDKQRGTEGIRVRARKGLPTRKPLLCQPSLEAL
jgi:hypothetical protein